MFLSHFQIHFDRCFHALDWTVQFLSKMIFGYSFTALPNGAGLDMMGEEEREEEEKRGEERRGL